MNRRTPDIALVVLVYAVGCGEIREIPVAESPATGDGSTGTTSGGTSPTSGSGGTEDIDVTTDDTHEGASESGEATGGGGMTQFCATAFDGAIPDDGQRIEVVLDLPAGIVANTLTTSVRIEHPRSSELRVELVGPEPGTAAILLDMPPCAGANVEVLFDDAAQILAHDECDLVAPAAVHGVLVPLEPLEPLLADSLEGEWTLRVEDGVPGEEGYLGSWCLNFWNL